MASIRSSVFSKLPDSYYVFVIMLSTTALVGLLVDLKDTANAAAGSPVFKILWGSIYLISLLRVIARRHEALALIKANKALSLLVLIPLLSSMWSIDRSASLHIAGALSCSILFCIDFTLRFSIRRQLELVRTALVILLALSVLVELLIPGFMPTRDEEVGAWHGVWAFKNDFGRAICLGTVACFALARSIKLRCFIFVCGVTLTILSKSVSATGYTVLLCATFLALSALNWKPKPRLAVLIGLAVLAAGCITFVAQNYAEVLASLDKDPHLTGRTDLWSLSIEAIERRPLLGYGYQAFWTYDSQPARRIREAINWPEAPHAHNGYIDITLGMGLVGFSVYCLVIFIVTKDSIWFLMRGTEDYRKWPLVYVVFVSVYQITEGTIFAGNSYLTIIFVSLAFSLSLERKESAVQQTSQLAASAA